MSVDALEFYQKEIESKERWIRDPYVGFFSPMGILIDFNTLLGGKHHEEWRNPVSMAFLKYISYIVDSKDYHSEDLIKKYWPEKVEMKQVEGYDNLIYRGYFGGIDGYDSFQDITDTLQKDISKLDSKLFNGNIDEYDRFKLDLLLFFRNAYKDKDFFKIIGRIIKIGSSEAIYNKVKNQYAPEYFKENERQLITEETIGALMSYFKDICIMYLGYDSLETFKPNGKPIIVDRSNSHYFLDNPRVITSSYFNIYERFFNYLIMDWDIHRVPRYVLDPKDGIYKKQSDLFEFHEGSRENEYKEEVEKIKKLVPIKDRYKYFL
jgi:hypothetical protein